VTAPSAFQLQRVLSIARETVERLRTDDGLVLETEAEILTALADEGVQADAILRRLVRAILDAKASDAAATTRLTDLTARRTRFKRQEQAYRGALFAAMDALGLRRFADVEATVVVSDGRPKVIVTDIDALPAGYVQTTTINKPDLDLIEAALERGETVPGATHANGTPTLIVRSK
jgi:hypothetical protein